MNYTLITYSFLHPMDNKICVLQETFNTDIADAIRIFKTHFDENQSFIKIYSIIKAELIGFELHNTYVNKGLGRNAGWSGNY